MVDHAGKGAGAARYHAAYKHKVWRAEQAVKTESRVPCKVDRPGSQQHYDAGNHQLDWPDGTASAPGCQEQHNGASHGSAGSSIENRVWRSKESFRLVQQVIVDVPAAAASRKQNPEAHEDIAREESGARANDALGMARPGIVHLLFFHTFYN
jgi:hypothetical protein